MLKQHLETHKKNVIRKKMFVKNSNELVKPMYQQ